MASQRLESSSLECGYIGNPARSVDPCQMSRLLQFGMLAAQRQWAHEPLSTSALRLQQCMGLAYDGRPFKAVFRFANHSNIACNICLNVWFPTAPPTDTCFEVVEECSVPLLLSLEQMACLRVALKSEPGKVYLLFCVHQKDGRRAPSACSTSRHVVIDFCKYSTLPGRETELHGWLHICRRRSVSSLEWAT